MYKTDKIKVKNTVPLEDNVKVFFRRTEKNHEYFIPKTRIREEKKWMTKVPNRTQDLEKETLKDQSSKMNTRISKEIVIKW